MMRQDKADYPAIKPLESKISRPFWSVMIPTMERPEYLKLALQSVLDQKIPAEEMQIEVIGDDITSLNTQRMVEEMGSGRVSFCRQRGRKSQSEQWTACMERAEGSWVHIFHDDDTLQPEFYKRYENFIKTNPETLMVFSRANEVNKKGKVIRLFQYPPENERSGIVRNALRHLLASNYIIASSAVVRREVYERIGGPDLSLHYALDWELFVRITASGPIGYIHEPCIDYRVHDETVSSDFIRSGLSVNDNIRIAKRHLCKLPEELRSETWKEFRRRAARRSLHQGREQLRSGFYKGAFRHAWYSFWFEPSRKALALWGKTMLRIFGVKWKTE